MEEIAPAVLAMLIPIIGIVMSIGLAMLGVWLDFRRKTEMFELHHRERMAAIEKGLELPPLAAEFLEPSRKPRMTQGDVLRRGLVLLLVGAALVIALAQEAREHAWWGLLPMGVGLAYLISYLVERGQRSNAARSVG